MENKIVLIPLCFFFILTPCITLLEISKHFIKPEISPNSFFFNFMIFAQLLVYADDVNILVGNVNTVKNGISSSY